jgi:hypothetical protein
MILIYDEQSPSLCIPTFAFILQVCGDVLRYYSNGRIFIYEDVSLFVYSTPYVRPHEQCDLAFGLNF